MNIGGKLTYRLPRPEGQGQQFDMNHHILHDFRTSTPGNIVGSF